MKVLLSAYQCGPGMGSVSQIGWEWYSRLAARLPVVLFTHIRNRPALEAAGVPFAGTKVHYIDTEWFAGPLYRGTRRLFPRSEHSVFLISSLDFYPYDAAVVRQARELMAGGERVDIAHAVTPVSPAAITRLHKLGIPVVLGPWNGGLSSPKTFPDLMSQDSGWVYRVRSLATAYDRIAGCTQNAARILVANETTRATLPPMARRKCDMVLENGVDLGLFRPADWPAPPSAHTPLKILFVGRLIPVKGVTFLIEAAKRLREEFPLEITIAGDGPMRGEWEALARSRGVDDVVRFVGARTLDEIAELHRESHAFCLPSVRESGGAVLLEAMACGRPILAVKYGGPAVVVDHEVGCPLPADGAEPLIAAIVEAFRDIVRNPEEWRARGLEGWNRANSQFSWDAKIDAAVSLYSRLKESLR